MRPFVLESVIKRIPQIRHSGRSSFIRVVRKNVEHTSTQGNWPRNFVIDPTGKFLLVANQRSDNVVIFRIDSKTGRLTPSGHTAQIPAPVCLKFP